MTAEQCSEIKIGAFIPDLKLGSLVTCQFGSEVCLFYTAERQTDGSYRVASIFQAVPPTSAVTTLVISDNHSYSKDWVIILYREMPYFIRRCFLVEIENV